MNVRTATGEDVEGIRRVARAAYRRAYPPVLGEDRVEELLAEWYSPDAVTESLSHPESRTFVAEDGGRVVGFATAGAEPDAAVGTLGALYVHPDRWGEGIGTALLERANGSLRDRGVSRLRIHVFAGNRVGMEFYAERADRVDREVHEVGGASVSVAVFERDLE